MKVKLIVVEGKPQGYEIPITRPQFLIGRGEQCHLRPNSELVSRKHCLITVSEGKVRVRDLGSRNGTLVNGQPLKSEVEVHDGDRLQIGALSFEFQIVAGETASLTASTPPPSTRVPQASSQMSRQPTAEFNVEQWLLGDGENEPPERPSGVFDGATQTVVQSEPSDEQPPAEPPAETTQTSEPKPPPKRSAPQKKPTSNIDSSEAAANLLRQMMNRRK